MPDPAPGIAEIAALRERLARLEATAAAPLPDPARKALERAAYGFVSDPQSEAALVARAKDPTAWAAAQRGESPLVLDLYARGREAAIAIGAYSPKEGGK